MALPDLSSNSPPSLLQTISKVIIVLVLLGVIVYLLLLTGTIKCNSAPFLCDLYYSFKGNPRILIVHGDDGLGDPELLKQVFQNRDKGVGVPVSVQHLKHLSSGNIKDYDLIIVTKARTMSTQKIKMFIDYALVGGKLVWTGDAGTALESRNGLDAEKGDFLYKDEDPNYSGSEEEIPHEIVNPWARKLSGKVVLLNQLLGVDYVENYCSMVSCAGAENIVGRLEPLEDGHSLIRGLRSDITFKVFSERGFAISEIHPDTPSTIVLLADTGGQISKDGVRVSSSIPIIVVSAKSRVLGTDLGENVAYYAMPLENFFKYDPATGAVEEDFGYFFVQQLYHYMLYGG